MIHQFSPVDIKTFTSCAYEQFHKQWLLVTARKPDGSLNTMTASWGGFGIMWNKVVAFLAVRPQRRTREFLDESELFTLSFFDENHRAALNLLGTVSGYDEPNKIRQSGLTPFFHKEVPFFEEAELLISCRKLFRQETDKESYLDAQILQKQYSNEDYHILYFGELLEIFKK